MNCVCPVAPAQELQRGDELGGEEVAPAPVVRERRERADDVEPTRRRAVGGLLAPDREQDLGRHAELRLDARERRRQVRTEALPAADAMLAELHGPVLGVAHRRDRGAVGLRIVERHDARVGYEARELAVERLGLDADGQGLRAEMIEPRGERRVGRERRHGRSRRRRCRARWSRRGHGHRPGFGDLSRRRQGRRCR
jgi:hypothetical protein